MSDRQRDSPTTMALRNTGTAQFAQTVKSGRFPARRATCAVLAAFGAPFATCLHSAWHRCLHWSRWRQVANRRDEFASAV